MLPSDVVLNILKPRVPGAIESIERVSLEGSSKYDLSVMKNSNKTLRMLRSLHNNQSIEVRPKQFYETKPKV